MNLQGSDLTKDLEAKDSLINNLSQIDIYGREIKRYLLPYQCILKVSRLSTFVDNVPMIPDLPPPSILGWQAADYECVYEGYSQTLI